MCRSQIFENEFLEATEKQKENKMNKIAVIFWTGTGNTEIMANEVVAGAKESFQYVRFLGG